VPLEPRELLLLLQAGRLARLEVPWERLEQKGDLWRRAGTAGKESGVTCETEKDEMGQERGI